MNKIASYLQGHVRGEVLTGATIREYFSRDNSILSVMPDMAIYPFNTNDVRKVTKFTWQLAEKKHILPMTVRGLGSDTTGAAIGRGIVLPVAAHMNRILEVDTKQQLVRVQPGLSVNALQETVHTHGLTLPMALENTANITIGGAVGNNLAGACSLKYGTTRYWVNQLEVVLASGDVIQTGRISRRELNKKKGLSTFEGDIYRQLDGLIEENQELIQEQLAQTSLASNVGYALDEVKHKDGSFDLTPLIAGAQGTLGIATEMILRLAPYTPQKELLVVSASSAADVQTALDTLRQAEACNIELLDGTALEVARQGQGVTFTDILTQDDTPAALIFAEFDDVTERHRRRNAKKAQKALNKAGYAVAHSSDFEEQENIWQQYNAAVTAIFEEDKNRRVGLPIIEDVRIPEDKYEEYQQLVVGLGRQYRASWPIWGHAGEGRYHVMPLLDLARMSDRQKVVKLIDDYYSGVTDLGGVIAARSGEGRLRAPFVNKQYSRDAMDLFDKVKQIFDPYGTLNPGVKTGTDLKAIASAMRSEYSGGRYQEYLPRV